MLPFANFGPADDRCFCDGLTEEIINGLARFPGLRVISRTSAFAAHSQGGDISAIGSRLGVTHAIEGSVRRSGDRIRVTAQLIEAGHQSHLWSERFDRALADVFVIQDEIELDYDWAEVDREFARAMELDSQSSAVRFRRALCGLMPHGRTAEAAAELERVVDTDPLSVVARWWLGSMYWFSGQISRVHEQAERMLEIDPTHPLSHMMLGTSLFAQGKLFEAVVEYEKAAALGGRLPWLLGWLGLACAAAGYRDRASAIRDKLVADVGHDPQLRYRSV